MEKMDIDDAKYQRFLADKRTRKSVTLATEVKGISRAEQDQAILRHDEMFKEEK